MDKEYQIRTFLESPKTYEMAVEHNSDKILRKRRCRKRKEMLPPYIPFKSIYEETQMEKLTERQRIMVQKFRSVGSNANSLFIAANDIQVCSCGMKCVKDGIKTIKFLHWMKAKMQRLENSIQVAEIENIASFFESLIKKNECFCETENNIYHKIVDLLEII